MPSVSMGSFGILHFGGTYKKGDPPPAGYLDRHEWAAVQLKAGLKQVCCDCCSLYKFPQELSSKTIGSGAVTSKGVKVKVSRKVCLECEAKKAVPK